MQIGPETVVTFHYTLRDEAGAELETSRDGDPTAYLHGANNIIPGLETAMTAQERAILSVSPCTRKTPTAAPGGQRTAGADQTPGVQGQAARRRLRCN